MIKKIDKKNKFVSMFNPDTGFYVRSGVIENGKDTGVDPFMTCYPELIDVGVMGHCVHGKSGLCSKSGVQCYQNGLGREDPNMSLEDFKRIVDESKGKTFQLALGGRGDVDEHEHFEELLAYCRENNIVPNFTTSGLGMTKEKAEICKRYCGAVAVSMYSRLVDVVPFVAMRKREANEVQTPYSSIDDIPVLFTLKKGMSEDCYIDEPLYIIKGKEYNWEYLHHITADDLSGKYELYKVYDEKIAHSHSVNINYTLNAIEMLLAAGVKTNIHYVLGKNTIQEAILRLKYNGFPKGINAIIFLLHKPVGLGQESNVLNSNDPRVKEFFKIIDMQSFEFKIGFDSCTVPALINMTSHINEDSFDTCEGGRWSAYITSDMKMIPCSFDNQDMRWAYDISNDTIQNAWNSRQFEDFRDHFRNSCSGCNRQCECRGGCPIRRQIVLCDRKEKDLYESTF